MRILLLTQFFDPEPTFKGLVFAKSLVAQGHQVTVITGFPNYPGGKVYDGYEIKFLQKEIIQDVKIFRVPLYPSHGKSKIGRILNYVSFCISSFFALLALGFKNDVIYVYHPPATVGASAALASLITRTPFVYDIQDLWPDTLSATGMLSNKRILNIIGKLCAWIYSRAASIVVLSPGFKKRLVERGVPENKIELIYNWCDEQSLLATAVKPKEDFKMENRFNVVFAGNMGKAQALGTVLAAAEKLYSQNAKILFTFVGGGLEVDHLKSETEKRQIKNVQFLARQPMNEIGAVLKLADVLLVHLKSDPLFAITIPSKTQAYLAIGRPVLMAVEGDASSLVKEAQAGLATVSENSEVMAQTILKMSSLPSEELIAMGEKGQKFYFEKLSLKVGTSKFIDLFERTINEKA
jgi:glycosyltransferase involved in cell wall biosynthesis